MKPTPQTPKHLIIISGDYPGPARPTHGVFVRQLAHATARQGVQCSVIQPVAMHLASDPAGYPEHSQEEAGNNAIVNVYRPRFLSLSSRGWFANLGPFNPSHITLKMFTNAIRRVIKQENLKPDAVYGHFFCLAGMAVVRIGEQLNIPSFIGMGESVSVGKVPWTLQRFSQKTSAQYAQKAAGFVCNSTLLKKVVHSHLAVEPSRIGVFPNGYNPDFFSQRDRQDMRRKLNLPEETFIVGCTGAFSKRKGQLRVAEAIKDLDNVKGIFIGGGVPEEYADKMLVNQPITHEKVADHLSACDIFVLPTLQEGSCNGLVEAMACGLPIVSSKGEFNDDLLADEMSIRVDPMDVRAIREAIVKLRDDRELRQRMAEAALRHARNFDVNQRARNILEFMGRGGD